MRRECAVSGWENDVKRKIKISIEKY